ncbi:MAG: hypothetical protein ACI3XT_05480 [Butyricicoccaceae bacterium]
MDKKKMKRKQGFRGGAQPWQNAPIHTYTIAQTTAFGNDNFNAAFIKNLCCLNTEQPDRRRGF